MQAWIWILGLVAVAAGCHQPTIEERITFAGALEDAGKLDSALMVLDQIVSDAPNHLWARLERGVVRSRLNDQIGAIEDATEVARQDPLNETAYFNRALAKGRKGDHPGALEDLIQTMKVKFPGWHESPSTSVFVYYPADIHLINDEASEFFVPMADVGYLFALTYVELDSVAMAKRWLDHCIDREYHLPDCLYERGIIQFDLGRTSEGCADLNRAASLGESRSAEASLQYCR